MKNRTTRGYLIKFALLFLAFTMVSDARATEQPTTAGHNPATPDFPKQIDEPSYIGVYWTWGKTSPYPSILQALEENYGKQRDEALRAYNDGDFMKSAQNYRLFFSHAPHIATAADLHKAAIAFNRIGCKVTAQKYLSERKSILEIESYFK